MNVKDFTHESNGVRITFTRDQSFISGRVAGSVCIDKGGYQVEGTLSFIFNLSDAGQAKSPWSWELDIPQGKGHDTASARGQGDSIGFTNLLVFKQAAFEKTVEVALKCHWQGLQHVLQEAEKYSTPELAARLMWNVIARPEDYEIHN